MLPPQKVRQFMHLAKSIAAIFSKDPCTKVCCLCIDLRSYHVVSSGYNGMPRGLDETRAERWKRPLKYDFCCHAEMNYIANAAMQGASLRDTIAFVTLFPCLYCTKAMIQSGIRAVVVAAIPDLTDAKWGLDWQAATEMFRECKVEIIFEN
jgi:dCMP deaminase